MVSPIVLLLATALFATASSARLNLRYAALVQKFPPPPPPSLGQLLRSDSRRSKTTESLSVALRLALTGEHCYDEDDCQDPRGCFYLDDNDTLTACTVGQDCFCRPSSLEDCTSKEDCDAGEVCVLQNNAGTPFCVSESRVEDSTNLTPVVDGLTGESCTESSECEDPRLCLKSGGDCNDADGCICRPRTSQICKTRGECDVGETCVKLTGLDTPVCYSEEEASGNGNATPIQGALTLDDCDNSKDCEEPRVCRVLDRDDDVAPCRGREGCFCRPVRVEQCTFSSDCVTGEVCCQFNLTDGIRDLCVSEKYADLNSNPCDAGPSPGVSPASPDPTPSRSPGASATSGTVEPSPSRSPVPSIPPTSSSAPTPSASVSPGAEPTRGPSESPTVSAPSSNNPLPIQTSTGNVDGPTRPPLATGPGATEVCIDARALHGFDSVDLVYELHPWARVLCDPNESCATAGHMVSFNGKTMMMKTYCRLTTCQERVMRVNSPKYKKALRVNSNTSGLHFTTFAARYETGVEEALMSMAVRAGF